MLMKKTAAVVLAVTMIASLAGCRSLPAGKTASASSKAELKPEAGATLKFRISSTSQKKFVEDAAAKFKDKYGVSITVMDGNVYDQNKTNMEAASGKGPDVFMSPNDKTVENQRSGILLKFDSRIKAQLQKDVNPVAMKTVTVKNEVYAVPVSVETYVMFYNKKLVKGAPATSFEQLLKESKTFNDKGANKWWFLSNVCEGATMFPMLSTYGYKPFGKDGTDNDNPGFDQESFKKGLEVLAKYHELMPVGSGDLSNWDFLTNQFKTGKTAYLISGPWNIKTLTDEKVDFGITSLPTYDGKKQSSFAFFQNAQVSAATKYPIASQMFAAYLVSGEGAEMLFNDSNCITSRKDVSNVPGLSKNDKLTATIKGFNDSTPLPTAKRITYYWTICANIGPAVFDGTMTPTAAVDKAKSIWKTSVSQE